MDIYGLVLVALGLVALGMGVYELYKKTVVGRNISASTPEQIRQFSKVDGICYLVEALIAFLLAFSQQIPFLATNDYAKFALAILFVAVMIVNFILARKLLNNFPDEKKRK